VSDLILPKLDTMALGHPDGTGHAPLRQRRIPGRWHIGPEPVRTDASARSPQACASSGGTRHAASRCVLDSCYGNHVVVRVFGGGWSVRNHAAKSSSRIRTHRPMRQARRLPFLISLRRVPAETATCAAASGTASTPGRRTTLMAADPIHLLVQSTDGRCRVPR
jgi:hypothetical protein